MNCKIPKNTLYFTCSIECIKNNFPIMYKKKHKGITKDGGEGQVDTYPNTRK
jgi:hypothetical protein